jgi:hypothetical protein
MDVFLLAGLLARVGGCVILMRVCERPMVWLSSPSVTDSGACGLRVRVPSRRLASVARRYPQQCQRQAMKAREVTYLAGVAVALSLERSAESVPDIRGGLADGEE